MPDSFTAGESDNPEDSAYRFVVLGHPELGEFLDWDTAVAKAWSVTPPGGTRVEVTIAPKGVQQFRTSDPNPDDDPSTDILDGIVIAGDKRAHQIEEFHTDATDFLIARTYCGKTVGSGAWVALSTVQQQELGYTQCPGCFIRR